mmetsp:Transcript_24150/g.51491  ORF Transcript_24150/g.51491 Transcript_24150/m.51491 type:complete len:925 (-) Transcript_24150:75-2849(-)
MEGLLGGKLLSSSGEIPTNSVLQGVGVVALYFSAHWCPPCKAYTPQLKKAYNRCKAKGKSFEIIFVSSDRDEHSFREYFGTMPWYAIPFADRDRKQALSNTFRVNGIPSLILLRGNGDLLNPNARAQAVDPSFPATLPSFLEAKAQTLSPPTEPVTLMLHHRGRSEEIEVEADEGWEMLKVKIFSMTEVREEEQRLFGMGRVCGALDESMDFGKALAAALEGQRGSGLKIADVPDECRKASSCADASNDSLKKGRLDSSTGWVGSADDQALWYELDLSASRSVAGVALACRPDPVQFVQRFQVSVAEGEGGPWTPADGGRIFQGCETFPQETVRILFSSPLQARYVRIMPKAYHNAPAMRCDVLLAGPEADEPPSIVLLGNASDDDHFEFNAPDHSDTNSKMMEEQHLAMLQAKMSSLAPRLQQQVNSLHSAQKYENRALQKQALDEIPVCSMDALIRKEKTSDAYEVALMKKVLLWYKKFFFTWTNSPKCEHCGSDETKTVGRAQPDQAERHYGAGTVEVAQCKRCSQQTRFPRYNDPGKLLEWRTGRCGEWANCFTLICRSLGYEARHVHDWTDHVWTEVYCQSLSRWVHLDSCEQAFDKPLIYEQGWGKKLTYCLAFARDHAVDVTQRYTRKMDELLTRRTEFSEQDLQRAMRFINDFAIDRSLMNMPEAEARRKALESKLEAEQKEFESFRTAAAAPKPEEQVGRTSGDAAWRDQRGELGANDEAKAKALKLSESGLDAGQPSSVGINEQDPGPQAKVKKIEVWSGNLVDMIRFTMVDGQQLTYGTPGGELRAPLELAEDEHISEVRLRAGDSMDWVSFQTNKGREASFGNAQGGNAKPPFKASEGHQIVGLRRPLEGLCPPLVGVLEHRLPEPKKEQSGEKSKADFQAALKAQFAALVASGVDPTEAARRILEKTKQES